LFFGAAFFCAELFFFVGLFFLGATLLFDIRLIFALVNYFRHGSRVFIPVFPCYSMSGQRYGYNGRNDIFDQGQLAVNN
jgi:hypothetical protein